MSILHRLPRVLAGAGLVLAGLALVAPALPCAAAPAGPVDTQRIMNHMMMPATRMNGVPLRDAIAYLRSVTGANVFVNWNALQSAGVTRMTPITLNVKNVSVRTVVGLILQIASPQVPLISYTYHNVLTITTRADANRQLVTKVYDVADLLVPVITYTNIPTFNLGQSTQNNSGVSITAGQTSNVNTNNNSNNNLFGGGGGGGGGYGGGQNLFGGKKNSASARGKKLVKLIEAIVEPNIWSTNGGPASIVYFQQRLIVTAPVYVQHEIGGSSTHY